MYTPPQQSKSSSGLECRNRNSFHCIRPRNVARPTTQSQFLNYASDNTSNSIGYQDHWFIYDASHSVNQQKKQHDGFDDEVRRHPSPRDGDDTTTDYNDETRDDVGDDSYCYKTPSKFPFFDTTDHLAPSIPFRINGTRTFFLELSPDVLSRIMLPDI
jgi:hypothetical protein